MTRPIDEKIIAMKLDNSDFKQHAVETTGLLGHLRNSLSKIPTISFDSISKSLSGLSNQVNNMNVKSMSRSLETLTDRFDNFSVVASAALLNVTNRAINAGLEIVKGLSLDPVMDGFNEYELKMGSIQTILSNTQWNHTGLNDVNNALNELNTYADQTIYNFSQMTQNIGRFTAAGVTLGDSTVAIKGLSNLAAVSGATSDQLNMAMYQMSQALSAGRLTLMDWNSLVNAGMGGKKTQDALIATAKAMGKNVDMSNGFRDSIKDGWLTSKVLLKTLEKFGKDKSMIDAATKVRTFSQLMATVKEEIGSGWTTTFEAIFGNFQKSTSLFSGLATKITGFFNRQAKERNRFVQGIGDGGGFINIFQGIQNTIKPIMQIFKAIGDGFHKAFPPKSVYDILALARGFKEFTAGLVLNKDTMTKLTTIFHGAFSVLDTVWLIAVKLGDAMLSLIPKGTGGGLLDLLVKLANLAISFNKSVKSGNILTYSLTALGKVLGTIGQFIGDAISKVYNFSGSLTGNLGRAINWIKEKLAPVGAYIKKAFGGADSSDILGAGTLIGGFMIVSKIVKSIDKFSNIFGAFRKSVKDVGKGFKDVFNELGNSLRAFQSGIKYNNLLKIAISVGIIAVSLKILEGVNAADISKGIMALTTSLGLMMGAMAIIDKFSLTGGFKASLNLIAIAIAVDIMASALKKVAELDTKQMIIGVTGLIGVTGALAAAIIALSKWGGRVKAGSLQLIAIATAVYILAGAIDKMARIDAGSLWKSIAALGVILAELAIFLKVANKSKLGIRSAVGLLATAVAIKIMVSAIKGISNIDAGSLSKGLIAIAAILTEMTIFSRVIRGGKLMVAGAGLLIVAAAINALMIPIKVFSGMSLTELAKGLGAMAIALGAVVLAAQLAKGSIIGAASILVMAIALNALMIPIELFAHMTWGELIKGFVGLAGGLALIAVTALLLTPAVVPMLAFGAALLLMGIAVLAVGAGFALLGTGLSLLATMTAASVAAIVSALGLLIKGFGSLILDVVDFVVKLGTALIGGMITLIPRLVEAIVTILLKLLETIANHMKDFIDVGVKIITNFLDGMAKAFPKVINSAANFVLSLINSMSDAIATHGPEFTDAVLRLMGEILLVMVDAGVKVMNALFGWIPGVKQATTKIGQSATQYIKDNFGAEGIGTSKGKGFSKALGKTSIDAKNAGRQVAVAGRDGASTIKLTDTGKFFGEGFASGMKHKGVIDKVVSAAWNLARAAKNKIEKWLHIKSPSRVMMKTGGWFGEGFAIGIEKQTKNVSDKARSLAKAGKESLSRFLDGFDPTPKDNEVHFKAVVDYDKLDTNKFGKPKPYTVTPDTSFTNGMVPFVMSKFSQNNDKTPTTNDQTTNNDSQSNDNQTNHATFNLIMDSKQVGTVTAPYVMGHINQMKLRAARAQGGA